MATSITMFSAFLILLSITCINGFSGDAVNPPAFVVNLDLPEEQRWTEVALKYKQLVPDIYAIMKQFLPDPTISLPLIRKIAADIDKYLAKPYAGEMRGIAKTLNMSLGDVVTCNLLYDISAFCTSIVMQDANGIIWHARNLDYSFTEILRNISIRVDYQKGGKTVYTGITYAGYVGLVTGQRPNAFTMTMDERDQGAWWMNILIAILDRNASPVSFLLRDVSSLPMSENFTSAVEKVAYTTTAASFYTIMGGVRVGEGAVITKGRVGPIDIWKLDAKSGRWYEVETNYDHWAPPPAGDDRRDPAIKAMNSMGQKSISKKSLFSVMSTPPVMNNKTTYTVVMSAAQPDIMEAWIRNP
ncbi:NAAA [Mytilus coruscus]|uniref:N-acylethanolamine-hydrolyzing acid amidase n=1 Tax=Mytilus coruscus TaxID=42192 RepID=A0A6J8CKF0_MYTCO|nr:NAAA [Mytilus coruscus]